VGWCGRDRRSPLGVSFPSGDLPWCRRRQLNYSMEVYALANWASWVPLTTLTKCSATDRTTAESSQPRRKDLDGCSDGNGVRTLPL